MKTPAMTRSEKNRTVYCPTRGAKPGEKCVTRRTSLTWMKKKNDEDDNGSEAARPSEARERT